jgi:branched-chain amino acid transport system ATP-binding protein
LAPEALKLRSIDAFYGDSHVLHAVTLACREGTLLGLIGRNGAGKSTCLNAVMGLVSVRGGAIDVLGAGMTGAPPEQISAAGVALVPQGRRIFRSLTVEENLGVARRRMKPGGGWDLTRVYETFPRLGGRRRQVAGSLSGGEQQMLAIGRALMGNPRLLLMDEPSEGLAPQIVADVGHTIARLKADGLSIVLVEQNIRLVLEIADDIAILNSGVLVHQGPAAALSMTSDLITRNIGVH